MGAGNPFLVSNSEKFVSDTKPNVEALTEYTEYINKKAVRMLQSIVQYSHMKQEEIEADMKVCKSYLSKVFAGRIELKFQHIVFVCRVTEFPVSLFMQILLEDETLNWEDYNNGLVKRMRRALICVHGIDPDRLAEELGHVEPKRQKGFDGYKT